MRLLVICLSLTGMMFLQGCIGELAAVVQASSSAISAYVDYNREPVVVQSAECSGKIEPIYPDDGYQERYTEDEKNQIAEQAVRLNELCGESE